MPVAMIEPVPYEKVRGLGFYRQFLNNSEWPQFMRSGRSAGLRGAGDVRAGRSSKEVGMKLEGSHTYPVPVEAVTTMLRDASATVDKYESMGHRDVEILDLAADDDTLRIVSSRVVDVDLPSFAKRALKPTNTMIQTDEWRRNGDGSWSGSFDVEVKGAPVHISGTMELAPDADGSRHAVTIDFQVKIPLVGGKIADWLGKKDVQHTLDAEFAFNAARLASG